MIAVGDDAGLPEPVHHVHHKDLVADPVGTVAALYRHFGLTLAPPVAAAVGHYARQRPNGGYGPRAYRFEDHGLDAGVEREKFRGYMMRFGIEPESGRGSAPGDPRATATRPRRRSDASGDHLIRRPSRDLRAATVRQNGLLASASASAKLTPISFSRWLSSCAML